MPAATTASKMVTVLTKNGGEVDFRELERNIEILATDLDVGKQAGLGLVASVAGRDGEVVLDKTDVGLANVDNTADADKPVSDATADAIAATLVDPTFTGTTKVFATGAGKTVDQVITLLQTLGLCKQS